MERIGIDKKEKIVKKGWIIEGKESKNEIRIEKRKNEGRKMVEVIVDEEKEIKRKIENEMKFLIEIVGIGRIEDRKERIDEIDEREVEVKEGGKRSLLKMIIEKKKNGC